MIRTMDMDMNRTILAALLLAATNVSPAAADSNKFGFLKVTTPPGQGAFANSPTSGFYTPGEPNRVLPSEPAVRAAEISADDTKANHDLVFLAGTIQGAAANCTRGHGLPFSYALTDEGRALVALARVKAARNADLARSFERGCDKLVGAGSFGCTMSFVAAYLTKR